MVRFSQGQGGPQAPGQDPRQIQGIKAKGQRGQWQQVQGSWHRVMAQRMFLPPHLLPIPCLSDSSSCWGITPFV